MRQSRFRACDLCEAICGLEFQFEGERMVAIRGDAEDPFSAGHVCPKGNAILDLEADPDRLRRPQLREGERWREIGWDALDMSLRLQSPTFDIPEMECVPSETAAYNKEIARPAGNLPEADK